MQRPGRLAGQIPEEHICKPAQGRKGVEAATRAAARAGHQQIRVPCHRQCGKGLEQHRLAAARIATDEGHPGLTCQRRFEIASKPSQLILARDQRGGWIVLEGGEGLRGRGVMRGGSARTTRLAGWA